MKCSYDSSFQGAFVRYYEKYFYGDNIELVKNTFDFLDKTADLTQNKNEVIADIGCGTGIYDELLLKRWNRVIALDLSNDMIRFAMENHANPLVSYEIHNICEKPLDGKVDFAIALSHVIGYMIDNKSLRSFFTNISNSLNPGGIFVFNFYNEPAILRGELEPREVKKIIDGVEIIRKSSVQLKPMESVLAEHYNYTIRDKGICHEIDIKENMRYFSVNELEEHLYQSGMQIVTVTRFLADEKLTENDWNGCIVAKKRG